ncbi:hypothetical protein Q9966_015135 [Columba livia]|nr:hypothetical protein Q9966_015135 [Columba livia]
MSSQLLFHPSWVWSQPERVSKVVELLTVIICPGEHWSCWALKVPFLSAFPAEATLMFSGECGSVGDEEEGQPWLEYDQVLPSESPFAKYVTRYMSVFPFKIDRSSGVLIPSDDNDINLFLKEIENGTVNNA